MGLLPLANAGRVVGVPEVILVLRFSQPRFLALLSASLAAVGLGTVALARSTAVVRNEIFVAVQTLGALLTGLHRVPQTKGTRLRPAAPATLYARLLLPNRPPLFFYSGTT